MLYGWDATESHSFVSNIIVTDPENGAESTTDESFTFKTAAYRTFINDESEKNIDAVSVQENNEETKR